MAVLRDLSCCWKTSITELFYFLLSVHLLTMLSVTAVILPSVKCYHHNVTFSVLLLLFLRLQVHLLLLLSPPSPNPPSPNLLSPTFSSVEETNHQSLKRPREDNDQCDGHDSDSPVTYKNNESTYGIFKWWNDRNKPLQTKKKRTGTYQNFKCIPFRTTNCEAKYYVTLDNNKQQVGPLKFKGHHNHLPPPEDDLSLRKEVRDSVRKMIAAGAFKKNIYKYHINNMSLPLSSTVVPTYKQLKNMEAYDKYKD
jgi:hypothetical protein